MGKRAEKEHAAIELYAGGMEIPQICIELSVSENSLRTWKKRAGNEWDEARAVCRKGMLASMEDVGSRLRRSREIAAALGGQAGLQSQGQMGQVVNELLRSLLFDLTAKVQTAGIMDGEEMAATIEQLKGLALTMHRLEGAANLNLKREAEIRKQAITDVADVVEKAAVQQGMNAEQAAFWRQQVLGVQ
jgi:uncharacterized protein YjcR